MQTCLVENPEASDDGKDNRSLPDQLHCYPREVGRMLSRDLWVMHLTWNQAGISSQLEVAGRQDKSGIPFSIEYSSRSGPGSHPLRPNIVSSFSGNELLVSQVSKKKLSRSTSPAHSKSGERNPQVVKALY
jgi:hypothetical protein